MIIKYYVIRCLKCNKTTGYFFACTKIDQEETKIVKSKGHMCSDCIQGKEVIYSWDNSY